MNHSTSANIIMFIRSKGKIYVILTKESKVVGEV